MSQTYKTNHYLLIEKFQRTHYWFKSRKQLLSILIKKFIPDTHRKTFIDIGCGTGDVLSTIYQLGFRSYGMDVNNAALRYAKEKTHATLIRTSLYTNQIKQKFDAVGAFDVLEHQTKDLLFIEKCYQLLKPNGYLFLTVPAGMWLWTDIDRVWGHKRRYEKSELIEKITSVGFTVLFINFWNVLPLPSYYFWRKKQKKLDEESMMIGFFRSPQILNILLGIALYIESLCILWLPFPTGATLVLAAQKSSTKRSNEVTK